MLFIKSLLFTGFFILFTGLSLSVMALCTLFPRPGLHWVVLTWSRTLCWVLDVFMGLKFEVRGRQYISETPAIYAAKHQSAWDTFIYFMIFSNPSYVLKKDLHRIPFWGMAANKYGAISVDRSGGASAIKQLIADTKDRLHRGFNVIIFPEGTRSAPGSKLPYHPGVAAMYGAVDKSVIPVAVNSGLFWGRRSLIKRPGTIVVEFLTPIEPGMKRRAFMEQLETTIEVATDKLVAEGIANFPETRAVLVEQKTRPEPDQNPTTP